MRHYLSLCFLRAGLRSGGNASLITQVPRDQLLHRLRQWDFTELTDAWTQGRMRISGYRGGYESRVRNAGDTRAVFEELDRQIGEGADRVALVPGRPVWEGVLGPVMTEAFIDWVRRTPATVWATFQLPDGDSAAGELLHYAATGIFQLTENARGTTALRVRKTAQGDPEPTTLPLVAAFGEADRSGEPPPPPRVLLMVPPGSESKRSFSTVREWLTESFEAREVSDSMDLLEILQEGPQFDLVVVFPARGELADSVRACHLAHSVGNIPVVAVVEDRVRAADRAHLIRAGADECLSAPVNLSELASRLDRLFPGPDRFTTAAGDGVGPRRESGDEAGGPDDGVVPEAEFRRRLRQFLSDGPSEVFTIVRLPRSSLPDRAEERLSEVVRLEDGDFVGSVGEEVAVYLAGTSPEEARGFLRRLASSFGDVADGAELLGSVRDDGTLRRLAGDG